MPATLSWCKDHATAKQKHQGRTSERFSWICDWFYNGQKKECQFRTSKV